MGLSFLPAELRDELTLNVAAGTEESRRELRQKLAEIGADYTKRNMVGSTAYLGEKAGAFQRHLKRSAEKTLNLLFQLLQDESIDISSKHDREISSWLKGSLEPQWASFWSELEAEKTSRGLGSVPLNGLDERARALIWDLSVREVKRRSLAHGRSRTRSKREKASTRWNKFAWMVIGWAGGLLTAWVKNLFD